MMMLNIADFVPLVWKVTVLLAAAASVDLILRRRSASMRHLVWSSALAGAMMIPFLSAALPRWTIPVWADLVPPAATTLFRVDVHDQSSALPEARLVPVPASAATRQQAPPGTTPWVAVVWLLGALALSLPALVGSLMLSRVRRRALPAPEDVVSLARVLARGMGLRQRVRVRMEPAAITPMTWGVFRPVVLLPESVAKGDPQRLRIVLLHELAHIARRDYLLHLLGQAACAVYWFHPLVWLARRKALRLREQASDDEVLARGVRPSDYASSLLQLSRTLAAPRLCGSLGICRPSSLEHRVRAILDSRLRRGGLTRTAALVAITVTAIIVSALTAAHPALAKLPRLGPPAAASFVAPQVRPAPDLAVLEQKLQPPWRLTTWRRHRLSTGKPRS